MRIMRAKMKVESVEEHADCENLVFAAVCKSDGYPADGSDENNTYARWTPAAQLAMTVNNPSLLGKIRPGEEYYLDFTKAE